MKRISYLLSLAALAALTLSCVKDKVYGVPVIENVQNSIALTAETPVTVTADISSLAGISTASLTYKAEGAAQSVAMTASGQTGWSAEIPAFALGTEVSYYIEAVASTGESTRSKDFSYKVGDNPIDYSGLVLNELNGNDKFIELYNGSKAGIDITGLQIFKDGKSVWTSVSRVMNAGEYLLLYSEDVTIAGEAQEGYDETLVFHSGLSAKKAVRVYITKPDGSSILDDFNFAKHPGTKISGSYGRNADGKWYIQTTSTPGSANVDGTDALNLGE